MAVVLPAPLGPIMPTIEPRGIARSTPVRATTSSNWRLTPRSAAIGSLGLDGRGLPGRPVLGVADLGLAGHRRSVRAGPLQAPRQPDRPALRLHVGGCGRVRGRACRAASDLQCRRKHQRVPASTSSGSRRPYLRRRATLATGRQACRRRPWARSLADRAPSCPRRGRGRRRAAGGPTRPTGATARAVPCPQATSAGASSGPSIR